MRKKARTKTASDDKEDYEEDVQECVRQDMRCKNKRRMACYKKHISFFASVLFIKCSNEKTFTSWVT